MGNIRNYIRTHKGKTHSPRAYATIVVAMVEGSFTAWSLCIALFPFSGVAIGSRNAPCSRDRPGGVLEAVHQFSIHQIVETTFANQNIVIVDRSEHKRSITSKKYTYHITNLCQFRNESDIATLHDHESSLHKSTFHQKFLGVHPQNQLLLYRSCISIIFRWLDWQIRPRLLGSKREIFHL